MKIRAPLAAHWRTAGFHHGLTIGEEIRRGAAKYPNTRIAIEGDGADFATTVAQLYPETLRIAGALANLGFKAGEVIALQLPNCRENLLVFLAALQLRMVVVPIVMIYGAAELGFILGQCRARALVIPGRYRNFDLAARVGGLPALPALERIIVVGDGELPGPSMRWFELENQPGVTLPEAAAGSADELCLINYTSGTTAAPKGVMHTHNSLAAEVRSYPGIVDLGDDAPYLGVTPAGHIGATILILRPFLSGTGVVFANALDRTRVAELIQQHSVSQIGGVPMIMNSLLDLPDLPRSLRVCVTGGAGVPPSLIERGEARGLCIIRSYGSTEHPTVSAGAITDSLRQRAYTDGRLAAGTRVRLLGDDDREVPSGDPGEIVTMGPELFVGYFDSSLDADSFTADGWYRTGDIGVMDADGLLAIVDRKKDIIIRGGENVSSQDVEAVLSRHPAVQEAIAVAWPDEVYGERVGVFVRLRPGSTLDIPAVQAHFAAAGVAKQKTPERLVVVEDFERTAMGKVVKAALRKRVAGLIEQTPRV